MTGPVSPPPRLVPDQPAWSAFRPLPVPLDQPGDAGARHAGAGPSAEYDAYGEFGGVDMTRYAAAGADRDQRPEERIAAEEISDGLLICVQIE
jgi:hypothetical protein